MKTPVFVLTVLLGLRCLSAADIDEPTRRLLATTREVVFATPLTLSSGSASQQFLDILQKISDQYEQRWAEPLPIAIDLAALRHLEKLGARLPYNTGLVLHDAPLGETLRGWCVRASLDMAFSNGRIVVTMPKEK